MQSFGMDLAHLGDSTSIRQLSGCGGEKAAGWQDCRKDTATASTRAQRGATSGQHHLALGWGFYFTDPVHLLECLHFIPSLARFGMWMADSRAVNALFAALADSPSLLPNLRNLTIYLATGGEEPNILDSWRVLLRVLSTRRVVDLQILPVTLPPPADVLASLRELVAAGVEIYIGNEECNFVVA
ncbi:hypothetical protein C8R45DRAFT_1068620 [Mycena sanguinolenta]|nr:hypothetical protein C8R45DRAFT_1068620 [Mycena sanguinolenta]